jgi:hypothetical protein
MSKRSYGNKNSSISKTPIRRTPTRRKIGSSSSSPDDNTPKPPELRNSVNVGTKEEDKTSGWLGKIGL